MQSAGPLPPRYGGAVGVSTTTAVNFRRNAPAGSDAEASVPCCCLLTCWLPLRQLLFIVRQQLPPFSAKLRPVAIIASIINAKRGDGTMAGVAATTAKNDAEQRPAKIVFDGGGGGRGAPRPSLWRAVAVAGDEQSRLAGNRR